MEEDNEENSKNTLLSLPPEVLETILYKIDANSVINLANSSLKSRSKVFEALKDGISTKKYWASQCRHFYEDMEILNVLASFDSFMNVEEDNIIDDNWDDFMWKNIYLLAHDLPYHIQNSNAYIRKLSKLEKNIKMDFFLSQPVIQVEHEETERLPLRSRLTGCSGSFAWTTIFKRSSETLILYENMETSRKIISAPNIQDKNILQIDVVNFPRSATEPTHEEKGIRKVFPVMIILCDKCVYLAHLESDVSQQIPFSSYRFDKNYMKPIIAIHKNYLAIWSHPYDLRIYELSIGRNPNDPNGKYLHYQALINLNSENTGNLGLSWQKIATSPLKNTYFFSFKLQNIATVTSQGDGGRVRGCEFEIMITSPFEEMYRATVNNGSIVVSNPRDSDKQFCFTKNEKKPTLNSSVLLKSEFEKTNFQDHFKHVNTKTTMGYGMFIIYNENIIIFSNNGTDWFTEKLEYVMMKNQNQMKNHFQHIFNIKIISENMIAILSNSIISIVKPTISDMPSWNSEQITQRYFSFESLHLNIIKQIQADMLNSELTIEIPQVYFGYNKGNPYLWFEVCERSKKRNNTTTTPTTTIKTQNKSSTMDSKEKPSIFRWSLDNSTSINVVSSSVSIPENEINEFEKSLMKFKIFCVDFNQDCNEE